MPYDIPQLFDEGDGVRDILNSLRVYSGDVSVYTIYGLHDERCCAREILCESVLTLRLYVNPSQMVLAGVVGDCRSVKGFVRVWTACFTIAGHLLLDEGIAVTVARRLH